MTTAQRALIENMKFEVIPMKNLEEQLPFLPAHASVSVTCSPAKGIDATVDISVDLARRGHQVMPHLAARMIESEHQLAAAISRLADAGITDVFCIAGDGNEPLGRFYDSMQLIEHLCEHAPHLEHIGFGAYPDGHAFIDSDTLTGSLLAKQSLLAEAGIPGAATTQMNFDTELVVAWMQNTREAGFDLPFILGIPGAVSPAKLIRIGMRLGVGNSLRFLKKNKSMGRLLIGGGYDANALISPLAPFADDLGITGLHNFTFNQIEDTLAWQHTALEAIA